MKKGITLAVEVYLEGEQDPAADFAALATTTVRAQLQAAFSTHPHGLSLQIKKLQEQDAEDDDSGVVLPPPIPTTTPDVPNPTPAMPPAPASEAKVFPEPAPGSYTRVPKSSTKPKPPKE